MIYMAMFRMDGSPVSVLIEKFPYESQYQQMFEGARITDFKVKSVGNYTREEVEARWAQGLILPIKGYGVHPDERKRDA